MMVRERYSKVRMNYTNIATKIIQSVSRCYELTVSDSSLMAEWQSFLGAESVRIRMVHTNYSEKKQSGRGSIPLYPIYP